MSSHYILPSAEPDFQNVCSLDGMLKYVLPSWYAYHVATTGVCNSDPELPEFMMGAPPKLLPVLVHNYAHKTYEKRQGREAAAVQHNRGLPRYILPSPSLWITEMRGQLAENLAPGRKFPEVLHLVQPNGNVVQVDNMLWVFMIKLDKVLTTSSQRKWPIVWLPYFDRHHPEREAVGRRLKTNELDAATLVRDRWITLGRWIIANL